MVEVGVVSAGPTATEPMLNTEEANLKVVLPADRDMPAPERMTALQICGVENDLASRYQPGR